ncbi:hypothetical protein Gpo141_00003945 [Globisporangium polare]
MRGALQVLLALSLAGVVLLPIFGAVLHFQPRLVHGLHVEPSAAERNCYLAAGCYGVTLLLSGASLWFKKRKAAAAALAAASAAASEFSSLDKLVGSPLLTRRALTLREKQFIGLTSGLERQPSDEKRKEKPKKNQKWRAEEAPASINEVTPDTIATTSQQPDSPWDDECEPL